MYSSHLYLRKHPARPPLSLSNPSSRPHNVVFLQVLRTGFPQLLPSLNRSHSRSLRRTVPCKHISSRSYRRALLDILCNGQKRTLGRTSILAQELCLLRQKHQLFQDVLIGTSAFNNIIHSRCEQLAAVMELALLRFVGASSKSGRTRGKIEWGRRYRTGYNKQSLIYLKTYLSLCTNPRFSTILS